MSFGPSQEVLFLDLGITRIWYLDIWNLCWLKFWVFHITFEQGLIDCLSKGWILTLSQCELRAAPAPVQTISRPLEPPQVNISSH